MSQSIALIAYETPYAPCGGVAAVMQHLPSQFQITSRLPTIVISPYHHRIAKTVANFHKMVKKGDIQVNYDGGSIPVSILQLDLNGTWFFLKAEDERFFAGVRHPYDVGSSQSEMGIILLRDALFFGSATAQALRIIDPTVSWRILLQDWEAATVALALPSLDPKLEAVTFLTLHNSYDSGASDEDLTKFDLNPALCPGDTILLRAFSNVQKPIITVSGQFALDFSEEALQTQVLAPHLRQRLASKIVGINNGPFSELSLDPDILSKARQGDFLDLKRWKDEHKTSALLALDALTPTNDKPIWGSKTKFDRNEAAWFIMAGRDDPRQKGYDIACNAVIQLLERGVDARFIFFPIPGDEGLAGLSFLKQLGDRFPERVLVLPFIFQEGYFEFLKGATYGIMPSLYEPFGMANEFYLKGTVGIGRATGGILQQIVPLRSVDSFTKSVKIRSDRWYDSRTLPTGLLFREPDGLPSLVEDWRSINSAGYLPGGQPDRVEQRKSLALFQAMTGELIICLMDATNIFHHDEKLYYRLLIDGIDYIQNNFSWVKTAAMYLRYIL